MTDPHLVPIEELNLSVRAYNCLKSVQVNSVSDLLDLSYEDLLEIKNFGSKSADDVLDTLERLGMTLPQFHPNMPARQPVGPTDEELEGMWIEQYGYTGYSPAMSILEFKDAARAVLARWGQS
jgi:hypothetical protein